MAHHDGIPVQYRVRLMALHFRHPYLRGAARLAVCAACGQTWPCLTAALLAKVNALEDWAVEMDRVIAGCAECSMALADGEA